MTTDKTRRAFRGSMTAMVTPFRGGAIDWPRVDAAIERQVEASTDWVVACGTTGESPTLSRAERDQLIARVVARVNGRCGVMVGAGTNSTASTIELTRAAANAGADAALLVTPYYNLPTQDGLFRHFAAVSEAVDLPLVLYDVPGRTGVRLTNDVVVRLREAFPNIVAIKDATGDVDRVTDLLARCDIAVLSGDDALTWPMMALGATGVISVVANLVPELMRSLVTAARGAEYEDARRYHRKVDDLAKGLSALGPNPIPIKTAMAIAGMIDEEFRLPLCRLDAGAASEIERLLRRHEILEPAAA